VNVVITNPPRVARQTAEALAACGVATVHEARGHGGLMQAVLRPIYSGAKIAGAAVTVSVAPADNWMIHVAVEQCQAGDILVMAPTSPCDTGYFGELLASSLASRGALGLVLEAGCRDVVKLTKMGVPVWSKAVSAQGTVGETLDSVNVPVICDGQLVHPGDLVIADDDGVVVVPRLAAETALDRSRAREDKEAVTRKRLQAGKLGLDIYGKREKLAEKGLVCRAFGAPTA
jgi:4-hydroxy-4-methyl-2-oxoglutarate aldolase